MALDRFTLMDPYILDGWKFQDFIIKCSVRSFDGLRLNHPETGPQFFMWSYKKCLANGKLELFSTTLDAKIKQIFGGIVEKEFHSVSYYDEKDQEWVGIPATSPYEVIAVLEMLRYNTKAGDPIRIFVKLAKTALELGVSALVKEALMTMESNNNVIKQMK